MSPTEPLSQFLSEILEIWEANCGRSKEIAKSDRILREIHFSIAKEGVECSPESKF
jgi:hypothetical protein